MIKSYEEMKSLLVTVSARVLEKQVIILRKVFLGTFVEQVACMGNVAGAIRYRWSVGVKGNGM